MILSSFGFFSIRASENDPSTLIGKFFSLIFPRVEEGMRTGKNVIMFGYINLANLQKYLIKLFSSRNHNQRPYFLFDL